MSGTQPSGQHSDLATLNEIIMTLNGAADVRAVLDGALQRLVELVGLRTGWIFLVDEEDQSRWAGRGYRLAAHYNLPPALAEDSAEAWCKGCDCQKLCRQGALDQAYNEVRCSRLASVHGERYGLQVHASVPLRAAGQTLGILNVAAPGWEAFDERALAMLTNVGQQLGGALERAQLFELVQERRIHEQRVLLDFTNQLLSNRHLEDLLRFLVEEVQRLLAVDACAVLLPEPGDPGYLRFAAAVGWIEDPVAAGRRVPAGEESGSGRAMLRGEPLVIEDNEVTTELPWMGQWLVPEAFVSAVIVPLMAEGRPVGTLVVDSRSWRLWDREHELRLLQLMANQAAIAIQTTRLHEEEISRQRLEHELALARQIQLSMLPPGCPYVPGWDFCAHYEAAQQVGGDFYDFYQLNTGNGRAMGLLVADVADKGVPAALFMALSRTTLRNVTYVTHSPALALTMANNLLLMDNQSDMFLTAFYGVLEPETGRFVYASAGHNPPLVYRAAGRTWEHLTTRGIALGVLANVTIEEQETYLLPGDVLLMYTDGVTEAVDWWLNEFGLARLMEAAGELNGTSAEAVAGRIVAAVSEHMGGQAQADDFTLLVIRRLPQPQISPETVTMPLVASDV